MIFATGIGEIPPLGFQPKPTIIFNHAGEVDDVTWEFPVANTCSMQLRLPLLQSEDQFCNNMFAALDMATTFTRF